MIPPQNFKQIEKNGTKIADLETNCRIKIQYEVLEYKYSQIAQAKQNWASSQLDGNFKCLIFLRQAILVKTSQEFLGSVKFKFIY